ncbi:MAG: endospore germination permease [Clostridiales bacterium]|nr:endospore germination permease [Clostridiales bacterium]
MCTVALVVHSSSLLTSFVVPIANQDSWFAALMGFVLCLPLMGVYLLLAARFPGRNLMQILSAVYGKVGGYIVGALYLWFFATLTALNLSDSGAFLRLTIMVQTPELALMLISMIVSAYAVRNGLRVVVRYSLLFLVVSFGIALTTLVLVANQMNFQNFLPMFDQPVSDYVRAVHLVLTIPFGEMVMLLMIGCNVKLGKKKLARYWLWGFAMGAAGMITVVVRDTAVLGNMLNVFTMPALITLRLVNITHTLSRMEILFAVVLITLLYFKVTLFYYITVLSVAQYSGIANYRHIVLAVGALILIYALTLYPSSTAHLISARGTVPFIWTIFEFLIPAITLLVAWLRRVPAAREAAS